MEGSKCKSGQKIRSNIGINLQCQGGSLQISLGMATGQVRAGFLHTWTRPVGPNLRPGPGLIIKQIFFCEPRPAPQGPIQPNQKLRIKEQKLQSSINPISPHPHTHIHMSFFETSPKLNIKPTTKQPIPKIASFQISTATPKFIK